MEKHSVSETEQLIVSTSVLRQADKLPAQMVEQHRQILEGLGICGQSLQIFLAIPKEGWMNMIDERQAREIR